MTMKLIGAAFVIMSFAAIGIVHAKAVADRINELRMQSAFFTKMKESAQYEMSNFPSIILNCVESYDFMLSETYKKFAQNLKSKQYKDFYNAWKNAFNGDIYPLNKNDIKIIETFARTLDSGGLEALTGNLSGTADELNRVLETASENCDKKKKLYFSLWLYSGIFTVILLM